MNEIINCIFCNEDQPATDEHIIPEFIGGSLIIREVCKTCNDKMGSDFEGPLSNFIVFRLARYNYGIQGKQESPLNPFPNTGIDEDDSKIKLVSKLKPYRVTEVKHNKLESGKIQINLRVDETDENEIPNILETKIRRITKKEWPSMSDEEIDKIVNNALDKLPKKHEAQSYQPNIGYKESLDTTHLILLFMKIAYEIAFHHHGRKIMSEFSNNLLREVINSRDSEGKIKGTMFPKPDPFSFIEVPMNNHCVILCDNLCYVRLFNDCLSAIIQVSDNIILEIEDWVVYFFDYVQINWRKENFLKYASRAIS